MNCELKFEVFRDLYTGAFDLNVYAFPFRTIGLKWKKLHSRQDSAIFGTKQILDKVITRNL